MRKLIRDKLGMFIAPSLKSGEQLGFCTPEELPLLLVDKLDEKYDELRAELARKKTNCDRIIDELVDLYEVMCAIADQFASCDMAAVEEEAKTKREHRGGFTAGVVLTTKE